MLIDPTGMTVEEPEKNKKDFILIQKPKYSIVELAKNAGKGKQGKNKEYFEKSIIELATKSKKNVQSNKSSQITKNDKMESFVSLVNAVGAATTVLENVEDLSKGAKFVGKASGVTSMIISSKRFSDAKTLESKLEHGFDVGIGAIGTFGGSVGSGISIYWNYGGKKLHKMWEKDVLTPQLKMGVPAHAIMPFK